ncbi:MAG: response regulator [Myxococcales bacterium]|nr:response regulator [Myxococcales bacterium]
MKPRYDSTERGERKPPKVLVVDDDPSTVRLLERYLQADGYQVACASCGSEALERLSQGGISLVVLDVRMPLMNGFEVCRRIRASPSNARIPVIFLTAESTDEESELQGLSVGGDDYLRKPVRHRLLAARVKNLIRLADAERDRALLTQLAHSEKLATIGQIAAGTAHEINNPLAFILSNLNTLKGYLSDAREVIEAYRRGMEEGRKAEGELGFSETLEDLGPLLGETVEGCERVRRIVQQLKTFSREDGEEQLQPVDMAEVVASTLMLTERELSRRAVVEKQLSPASICAAPAGALRQVTLNLLMNALQAVRDGDPSRDRIRVATFAKDGQAVLAVSDTGCGIPPEHLQRIFEPFFTTKPVGVGTGMGLAVSINIVRKLGGTIDLQSEVGRGTTVTVRIPCEQPEDEPSAEVGCRAVQEGPGFRLRAGVSRESSPASPLNQPCSAAPPGSPGPPPPAPPSTPSRRIRGWSGPS